LRNILFGVDEANFFMFLMKYPFSREIATQSLWFVLACAAGFLLGYKLAYRSGSKGAEDDALLFNPQKWRHELHALNLMGVVAISYMAVVGGVTGFSYGPMTQLRESYGFIFELRMVYLLLLSHLLLNIHWRSFLGRLELRMTRVILVLYLIGLLLFQARSAIFEVGVCIIIPLLMWAGDRVRVVYVAALCGLLILPNIIVLGRMGIPDNTNELLEGLFSIEYTIILNKFLGAAIEYGFEADTGLSFFPQFALIIPSPLRDLFGIQAINTDYILELSDLADVHGGGFSLVAQMYTDFGLSAPLVFFLLGILIGGMNFKAANVGRVKLIYATAPLLYSIFVLSLRNDFGVFLKYTIQLFIVAVVMTTLLKIRLNIRNAV